jgi:uncharacterized membrane protein
VTSEGGLQVRLRGVVDINLNRNYAAVAADTFSSELGILSTTKPRLITAPWRIVPLGTNGGVTATGIHAGLLGSFLISATATLLIPFCSQTGNDWSIRSKVNFTLGMSLLGLCGSLLDSILGALLQASVIDVRTGKVIEGDGGTKVPFVRGAGSPRLRKGTKAQATAEETRKEGTLGNQSRKIAVGSDILSNNGVNLLMAATISLASILGSAWFWDVDWTGFFGLPGGLSEVIIYE